MPIGWDWQDSIDTRLRPSGVQDWMEVVLRRAREALELIDEPALLEAGCGSRCVISRNLRRTGLRFRAHGVDIDPACRANPDLDGTFVASLYSLPFGDQSYNLVLCAWVLEHLEHPSQALEEVYRVLKPGGLFMAWTPNLLNPATLAARVTPHCFHEFWRRLSLGPGLADNCRTVYHCNTVGVLRKMSEAVGFEVEEVSPYAHAHNYFRMTKTIYVMASLASQVTGVWPIWHLRHLLLLVARRPAADRWTASP